MSESASPDAYGGMPSIGDVRARYEHAAERAEMANEFVTSPGRSSNI